jgi:transaldolase/glucose-6-phosphate isomerase
MNALQRLPEFGQSLWLDFISRKILDSGELARLVKVGEVRGVTSNPAIFEKAIGEGVEYAPALAKLRKERKAATAIELYEALAIHDIQDACDVMRTVYDKTASRDGYVSLEVTMTKGERAADILEEARHLWSAVARPNVMIKVPGTADGIVAFEDLIADGINVNVTLLFAVDTYVKVANAYIAGLEKRAKKGGAVSKIGSVASFFVSRIDSVIDKQLEEKIAGAKNDKDKDALKALMGKAAIANAKLAYAGYKKLFAGKKWEALAAKGAQTQRVLWASTGTKSKAYSDVMYVDELIGTDTVNTAPPATIDAFRDHGKPRASLEEDLPGAKKIMKALEERGISMKSVTDKLLVDGLKLFGDAFVKLLGTIEAPKSPNPSPSAASPSANSSAAKSSSAKSPGATSPGAASSGAKSGAKPSNEAGPASTFPAMTWSAPKDVAAAVQAAIDDWTSSGKVERLKSRDAKLWTNAADADNEGKWLGWLDAPANARKSVKELVAFGDDIKKAGFTQALLLGMGGSSLCPEVFKLTYGSRPGFPTLEVLDSTDPAQIATIEKRIDLAKTLFIVASKSGSTLEPNIFEAYFFERAKKVLGEKEVGKRFVAITDPGSKLEGVAKQKGFRRIFAGVPSIGGRFSALSNFGMVPAATIGLDLERFTARAYEMARSCDASMPGNPGLSLGAFLGASAKLGRDKLTLVVSPTIAGLGAWLEQLIAESTGKIGKGIIPVDREPLAAPALYGNDRMFVYVRLQSTADKAQDIAIDLLEKAGHPVARIQIADKIDLGAEFFRWEIATAVAGSVLALNPFDQPDVEASKIATRDLTNAYEKTGSLPPEKPFFEHQGLLLFADAKYAQTLAKATGASAQLADVLRAHLGRVKAGDYFALLAYIERNAAHEAELAAMRTGVRDALHVATCLGFGPRFLHSTGQAYKGGPNSGVFLQITCADPADLAVPGAKYTFGTVKAAQARGDFQVLVERGRRALRAHITGDLKAGLATMRSALAQAIAKPAHATR